MKGGNPVFDFTYDKRRIWQDIFFLVLYTLSTILVCWSNQSKNEIVAVALFSEYWFVGICSLISDITPSKKIKPTVRTAGAFIVGAIYLIWFI